MHSMNGAQFLYIISLLLSFACLAATSSSASVIVINPLTSIYMYISLKSYKLDFRTEALNSI